MKTQDIRGDSQDRESQTELGQAMHAFMADLFPICRSITGSGVRETLAYIGSKIPLDIHEVPSGTQVFDWSIPLEWNIADAFIKDPSGKRLIDFQQCNLHVVNYSAPIHKKMTLADLKPHLHSLPDHPTWIPYRTSYYRENWGFCLSHKQLSELPEGVELEVCIESDLSPGSLTYGECYLPGNSSDEILISCHVCHPSLCNDNLSGIAVATFLGQWLRTQSHRYAYRILFIPATIGAIAWLAANRGQAAKIKHGFVLTGVGDAGDFTYKRTRSGSAEVDRAFSHVLRHAGQGHRTIDFSPYGYDERQYCSPGFNLPVGCLMRSPHGEYPEYHTSADNLGFVKPESLAGALAVCKETIHVLDKNSTYVNTNPHCEVQLGRRGLYRGVGGQSGEHRSELALLWILNLSDGRHSLLDIAERSGYPFKLLHEQAAILLQHDLLRESSVVQAY